MSEERHYDIEAGSTLASLFDDRQATDDADARAGADIAAGRLIGHDALLHWLSYWGTAGPSWPRR